MNETIKTIMNRRSYRAYKPEQITKDELSAILDCGLYAPSARNTQNWHFTVIQNKDLIGWLNRNTRETLSDESKKVMIARNGGNDDFSLFYNAPTIIMVSGIRDDRYSLINCSLATQNMCLAAESLNIGSCIIGMAAGLFDTPKGGEYIEELGIPSGYKPAYAVCFGYKGMEMSVPERIGGKVNVLE